MTFLHAAERLPLSGTVVLNLGWVWAGSVLGHVLADYGAAVIKVEQPGRPDILRTIPPLYNGVEGEGLYSHVTLRNQLSCSIDLQNDRGRDVFYALVSKADVVAENFRPGVADRMGIGYERLRECRQDLVMLSMSGLGNSGPYANIPSYGSLLVSMTGYDDAIGYPESGQRVGIGQALSDPLSGVTAASLVLAALERRDRTGEGDFIEFTQVHQVLDLLGAEILDAQMNGVRRAGFAGNSDVLYEPSEVFPCEGDDEWIAISIRDGAEWKALATVIGEAWALDPRLTSAAVRLHERAHVITKIGSWTRQHRATSLAEQLQEVGVPACPVHPPTKIMLDEHFISREAWVEMDHELGPELVYGIPGKLSRTPGEMRRSAVPQGTDTRTILRELLGLDEEQIADLRSTGAVATESPIEDTTID